MARRPERRPSRAATNPTSTQTATAAGDEDDLLRLAQIDLPRGERRHAPNMTGLGSAGRPPPVRGSAVAAGFPPPGRPSPVRPQRSRHRPGHRSFPLRRGPSRWLWGRGGTAMTAQMVHAGADTAGRHRPASRRPRRRPRPASGDAARGHAALLPPRTQRRARVLLRRGPDQVRRVGGGLAALWVCVLGLARPPVDPATPPVSSGWPAVHRPHHAARVHSRVLSSRSCWPACDRPPARLTVERPAAGSPWSSPPGTRPTRIGETVDYLAEQDYDGPYRVILVDNGSTDEHGGHRPGAGRASTGSTCRAGGDHAGQEQRPQHRVGCGRDAAGHHGRCRHAAAPLRRAPAARPLPVLAERRRRRRGQRARAQQPTSFWARVQEWDYFLGIASVKRMQGLYQGTLVAQGAFSLYETKAVRAARRLARRHRRGHRADLEAPPHEPPGLLRAAVGGVHLGARGPADLRPPALPVGPGDDRGAAHRPTVAPASAHGPGA